MLTALGALLAAAAVWDCTEEDDEEAAVEDADDEAVETLRTAAVRASRYVLQIRVWSSNRDGQLS
jgi:hypothetical protein